MAGVLTLYHSTIGKKVVMAVTGVMLYGFVVTHMVGNLKVYQGAEKFNAYAEWLRELAYPALGHSQALWILRAGLLLALVFHLHAAWVLTRRSRRARNSRYAKGNDLSFSFASKTMRYGGLVVLAFVIYHLLHLTAGTVHPDFVRTSPYHNLVRGFQVWPVAVAYMVCMVPLGLHMYHGLWSMTQTLDLTNPRIVRWRRPVAATIALVVVVANISIPLSVLIGWVS